MNQEAMKMFAEIESPVLTRLPPDCWYTQTEEEYIDELLQRIEELEEEVAALKAQASQES
jgi:hypothetical protein